MLRQSLIEYGKPLQATEADGGDALSEEDLLALGREVGLPARHIQRALLEERTGRHGPGGWLDRTVGRAEVSAARVIRASRDHVERQLLRWFEEEEFFVVQRRTADQIVWEPDSGFAGAMRRLRAVSRRGRMPPMLGRAGSLAAVLTDLESGFMHVHLSADLRSGRGAYVGGAAAAASVTVAGSAVLLTLGAFLPLALSPLALGAGLGWGISRQFKPVVQRTQVGLERVLDALELGASRPILPEARPSLLGLVSDELRRALRAPGQGGQR